ncbi:MAG: TatD family hydrolase [Halothiobacillaceae bacterium]|nr:TatD family hydrolase [Halothiobacillaceae bacterium]HER35281.1 amidohydrolase [Halothiobacillaceae bacterium]
MPTRTTPDRWAAAGIWVALLLSPSLFAQPSPEPAPLFDTHLHYNADQSEAMPPEAILEMLERHGVEHAVVTGTPPETVDGLARLAPDRIVPFLGAYQSRADKTNWMDQPGLPDRMERQLDTGNYRGIGELHVVGRDNDSPVLERVVEIAAERDLVLSIHGDLAVIDRIFAIDPRARVLWAHLGTDPDPTVLRAALARHPHGLFIDTSVRDARLLDDAGKLLPSWRALFVDHPNRFVIGVDTFSLSRWQRFGEVTAVIRHWLDQLPPSVARRIGRDNARELLLGPLQQDTP